MQTQRPLLGPNSVAPAGLQTDRYKLRMLCVNDLVKDFDAVMSSREHLQKTFSMIQESDWPEGLTLEENLVDLGWHQREFTLGYSFAYTVVTPNESRCLGCVYIFPSLKAQYDAVVTMWVRSSELRSGLDSELFSAVKDWINTAWPLSRPAYPGREIPVKDWLKIPDDS